MLIWRTSGVAVSKLGLQDFFYTNQGGDAVEVETDREFDAEEFDDLKVRRRRHHHSEF